MTELMVKEPDVAGVLSAELDISGTSCLMGAILIGRDWVAVAEQGASADNSGAWDVTSLLVASICDAVDRSRTNELLTRLLREGGG